MSLYADKNKKLIVGVFFGDADPPQLVNRLAWVVASLGAIKTDKKWPRNVKRRQWKGGATRSLSLGRLLRLFLTASASVPSETFLVEADNHLRAADVGHTRRHYVRFVAVLPFDEEH